MNSAFLSARLVCRSFVPAAIALVGLTDGACSRRRPSGAHAVDVQVVTSTEVLTARIDPDAELGPVYRGLFGTNVEWFNHAYGISTEDGSLDARLVQLAREEGISLVRFPGGTLSDFYHWRDGIGPREQRPVREHPTDSGKSPNPFGTPELFDFCQRIGADPLLTVNAGTSTPAEAADWVRYCNAPQNSERAADGFSQPLGVRHWEVGNELYLPGNPGDKQKITIPPEEYAERFLAFSAAMRNADPAIKLIAIVPPHSSRFVLPYPDWTPTLLKRASDQIDFLAVHPAYFPLLVNENDPPAKDVYQSLWAAPEAVDRSLTELDEQITKYAKGRDIGIAITEWGALISALKEWLDHVKTMGTAVYIDRLIQVFLEHPRVRIANYFKFTDRSLMGWVGFDGNPKIPYYVISLFTQHFGATRVPAQLDGRTPTFNTRDIGATHGEKAAQTITLCASVSADKSKVFVNIENRSWDTAYPVNIDFGKKKISDKAILYSLSSPGVTDNNGPDLPPDFPLASTEPVVSSLAKLPVKIEEKPISLKQPLVLQPFSIVTVEATLIE